MLSAKEWITKWQARRSYTLAELQAKLVQKDFPAAEIAAALQWAIDYAGANDREVAERSAQKRQRQHYGSPRIAAELEARGIASTEATRATMTPRAAEEQRAHTALLTVKERFLGDPRRAASWLARRGFEEDVVQSVVEKIIGRLED